MYNLGIVRGMGATISTDESDSYLVRVITCGTAFTWELCRGDGQLVIERSSRTFPTRLEAFFDSARNASTLALGSPQSFFSVERIPA